MNYYLAVDIGASSGRHILGITENDKIRTEEIHRFSNGFQKKDGIFCWDLEMLFSEILVGMKKCKEKGYIPKSIGIDTWGVDFVLVNNKGQVIGNTASYRDSRTDGMDREVYRHIDDGELYRRTGIQKQIFNTIFQLMAVKKKNPEQLENATQILMIPDYLHYRLSGSFSNEYTNATTTGLVSLNSKEWDTELLAKLDYPARLFGEIKQPGSFLGELTEEIYSKVGFNCKVVIPSTHDTASAVMAVPKNEHQKNSIYISSGTWSLIGLECESANVDEESLNRNFTNEGGYGYSYRYLKNIMGLWMIQSVKKELDDTLSFEDLGELAENSTISSIVDCNSSRFLSPQSMINEIQNACIESNQPVPTTAGELAAVVYRSLAKCYHTAVLELELLSKKTLDSIYIVGGGTKNEYLNQLTADYTNKTVYAGPIEATAIGNLLAQMIAENEFPNLEVARNCVRKSFEIKTYFPKGGLVNEQL